MSHKSFKRRRSFSAFPSAAEEARRFPGTSSSTGNTPSNLGGHGANAKPREVTTLERRVLAHERILQALISHLADDDPIIFEQLNARFGAGHDLGVYEQDYVTTGHYCEHFLGSIEQQIAARRAINSKSTLTRRAQIGARLETLAAEQTEADQALCQAWENEGGSFAIPLTPPKSAYFQIFRAESVMLTSTRLAGGDWQWQLHASTGALIAGGYGFRSELECLTAVKFLKNRTQDARIFVD
jgi:uncharacterized protein YegP (UPF0339 family)